MASIKDAVRSDRVLRLAHEISGFCLKGAPTFPRLLQNGRVEHCWWVPLLFNEDCKRIQKHQGQGPGPLLSSTDVLFDQRVWPKVIKRRSSLEVDEHSDDFVDLNSSGNTSHSGELCLWYSQRS